MNCALNGLNSFQEITATILRSDASHIIMKKLFIKYGFTIVENQLENGVPVYKMLKGNNLNLHLLG